MREEPIDPPFFPKDAKPITRDMLLGKTIRQPKIHHGPFLDAMSHLHMDGKKISTIQVEVTKPENNKQGQILPLLCPNLQILYL